MRKLTKNGKITFYILLILTSLAFLGKAVSLLIGGDLQDCFVSNKNDKVYSQQDIYSSLNNLKVEGNIITSTNNDPMIYIDTSNSPDHKYVRLDVDFLNWDVTRAQLFYSINGKGINEGDSIHFTLKSGVQHINLNKSSITRLRFDPANESGVSMQVNSVTLTNRFVPDAPGVVKVILLFLIWAAVWWEVVFGKMRFLQKLAMWIGHVFTKRPLLSTLTLVFVMALYFYRDFISTGISFFFTAGDPFQQTWPSLANLSDYLKNEGWPMWDFSIGLGSPFTMIGNPFLVIPVLLGKDLMPYSIVFMQISKIVLAVLFFYLFLNKLKFRPEACSIVSILYGFCGIMLTRAPWNNYATECVIAAFLLYAIERYLKDKKPWLIPIAICVLLSSFGFYYLYLYAILGFAYLTVRYIHAHTFKFKPYLIYIGKCGSLFIAGALLSSILLVPYAFRMFHTARFDTTSERINIARIIFDIFQLDNPKVYLSELFRFFSSDVLGVFDAYSGTGNYLEGPLFYCGIITLLLIPQAFQLSGKKNKQLLTTGIIAAFLYLIFPNVHIILNAFIHNSFKLSSLWICIIMLVTAAYVIDKIVQGRVLNKKILLITSVLLGLSFAGFLILLPNYKIKFVDYIAVLVIALIIIYSGIILYSFGAAQKKAPRNSNWKYVLFCTIILETFLFSSITVSGQFKFAQVCAFNKDKKQGYFDYSMDAVDYIKSIDDIFLDDSFFRIDKKRQVLLSDSLYKSYFGSSYYDSFVNKSYVEFLTALNAGKFRNFSLNNYSVGLTNRPLLQTLVGFKYQIADLDYTPPFGYERLSTIGNRTVYRNNYFLPIGYAYDKYISKEVFDTLNDLSKDLTLLNAVVLDGTYAGSEYTIIPQEVTGDYDNVRYMNITNYENNLPKSMDIKTDSGDPYFYFPVASSAGEVMHYDISYDIRSNADTQTQLFWSTPQSGFSEEQSVRQSIKANAKTTVKFIIDGDITALRIDPGASAGSYKIENLKVSAYSNDSYIQAVNDRRAEAFVMDKFSQNHITGSIETKGDRVLFFSIPYDSGWKLKIDGKPAQIEQVNIGFIGAKINEGNHIIELTYRTPGLLIGVIMSVIGLMGLIAMFVIEKETKLLQLEENFDA